jgi:hypothetical protein
VASFACSVSVVLGKSRCLLADSGPLSEHPGYLSLRREFNTPSQVTRLNAGVW